MTVHVETIDTRNPFFSVNRIAADSDDREEYDLGDDDALAINYDEAVIVVGDLRRFALKVLKASITAYRIILPTAEQDAALHDLGLSIKHATQPAGPSTPLYVYDADDALMTLYTIAADGTWEQQQRAFSPMDDWDTVATSETVKE